MKTESLPGTEIPEPHQIHQLRMKKISEKTGIGLPTLSKYNSSDSALYKGSFQNIVRIANYFRAPTNLFVEHIDC